MVNGNDDNGNGVKRKAQEVGERLGRGIRGTFFPTREQRLEKLQQQQMALVQEQEVAKERLKVANLRRQLAKTRQQARGDSAGGLAGIFSPLTQPGGRRRSSRRKGKKQSFDPLSQLFGGK